MPSTVWVATANIYVGTGARLTLAYTPGNIVPDSVVASRDLVAAGLVQSATVNDDGSSPDWRGTALVTRSDLDEAIAEALAGGADLGTSSASTDTLVRRSAIGASEFAYVDLVNAPQEPHQATRKDYVDGVGQSGASPNTIVRRNSDGDSAFRSITVDDAGAINAPTQVYHLTRKDYVDGIGTSASDVNTIVRRDAGGAAGFGRVAINNAPDNVWEATRKDYVDGLIAALESRIAALEGGA